MNYYEEIDDEDNDKIQFFSYLCKDDDEWGFDDEEMICVKVSLFEDYEWIYKGQQDWEIKDWIGSFFSFNILF